MDSQTQTVYVCMSCGSPAVEYSPLVGGEASCRACGWSGSREGLGAIPVRKDGLIGGESTFTSMYNDFRKVFQASAPNSVAFLVKWGFIPAEQKGMKVEVSDKTLALKYVNGIFQGALRGLLETRDRVEREKAKSHER